MKNYVLPLTLLLTACGELDLPEHQQTEEGKKFTFTVKGTFTTDPASRAATNMTADGSAMTDLWVMDYDAEGNMLQELHQTPSDTEWGAPTMTLALGTHHVKFLASRGQSPSKDGSVVTWTKPLDTFWTDYEVTVSKTSNGNRAVTLKRCAAKLQIYIDDTIPTVTTSLAIAPGTWYTGWNMATGVAVTGAYSFQHTLTNAQTGTTGLNLSLWSLSGTTEWTTDVAVTSYAGEAVNASAAITAAPMQANRVSVYHGMLYNATAAPTLTLDAQWLTEYQGTY